jgi:hypothetical protein
VKLFISAVVALLKRDTFMRLSQEHLNRLFRGPDIDGVAVPLPDVSIEAMNCGNVCMP